MFKKHRNPIILLSTCITLVIIYGITSGKLQVALQRETGLRETIAKALSLPGNTIVADKSHISESEINEATSIPEILTYIVKEGDTLEAISQSYNIKLASITYSNNISEYDILKIGQELRFPSIDGVIYRVRSGDSLWEIAKKYKVKLKDIVEVNNIEDATKISIDQELILPGAQIPAANRYSKDTESKAVVSSSTSASALWPARGKITSGFGRRWGRQHGGIDIAAAHGSDVAASMSGRVSFSGWKGSYGKLVIIDHENGLQSYYGHNSKLMVKVGQWVERGDIIAKVGSTGNATGPHIHFEIRENGKAVNPLPYLQN